MKHNAIILLTIVIVFAVAALFVDRMLPQAHIKVRKVERLNPYILTETNEKVYAGDKRFMELVRQGHTLVYQFSKPTDSDLDK